MKRIPCVDCGVAAEEVIALKILSRATDPSADLESQMNLHAVRPEAACGKVAAPKGTVVTIGPDAEARHLLRVGLERQGFIVREAATGSEGVEAARLYCAGAVLLDMAVAGPGGLEVIHRLREWSQLPILVLSGKAAASEAVSVLDQGANDYIAKPFIIEELSARLRAAQRFAPPSPPEIFKSGSLTVDLTNRTVQVGNSSVNLSVTEYSLLHLLVRHAGKVLTHAQILSEVWGAEMRNRVNYLRVYLRFLRKKLENPFEPSLFITQRAVGYGIAIRE